ncbi:MAG: hypothetical protein JSV79_08905 [Armatimonadota bacterium]|nr:MAG: hypothetical protein JSV79_08905 [Armatimonadota bacterium]
MINAKAGSIAALLVAFSWLATGCGERGRDVELARQRQDVLDSVPPFDPGYFQDAARTHIAVFFDIVDGELRLSPRPAEIRPGLPPFRPLSAGPVLVVYSDETGEELGRYAIEDPTMIRWCHPEVPDASGVRQIQTGTAEILLPHNRAIAVVEIGPSDGEMARFDVSGQIAEAREAQPAAEAD